MGVVWVCTYVGRTSVLVDRIGMLVGRMGVCVRGLTGCVCGLDGCMGRMGVYRWVGWVCMCVPPSVEDSVIPRGCHLQLVGTVWYGVSSVICAIFKDFGMYELCHLLELRITI